MWMAMEQIQKFPIAVKTCPLSKTLSPNYYLKKNMALNPRYTGKRYSTLSILVTKVKCVAATFAVSLMLTSPLIKRQQLVHASTCLRELPLVPRFFIFHGIITKCSKNSDIFKQF